MTALAIKLQAVNTSPAWQLVLDKFPLHGGQVPSLPERKIKILRAVVQRQQVNVHWAAAVKSKLTWFDSLEKQHGKSLLRVELVNSSRLLLHLGRASVLENVGLYADRTTGLPVIPGSAVKGVLSTWACWEEHFIATEGSFREFTETSMQRRNFNHPNPTLASAIFGDNSASGSIDAGSVAFLGGFPTQPPVLELDILTPHTDAAGQNRNPVPNQFLTIAPGTSWQFAFLSTSRSGLDSAALLQQVETWLKEALEQAGLGAKTAAGYGRFLSPDCWQQLTLDENAREAQRIQQEKDEAKAETLAKLRASAIGDYSNETIFNNLVINRLNKPGEYQLLQAEVKKIEVNPENAPWIEKITEALRNNKDARKRLKDKDWFPKEWLPQ